MDDIKTEEASAQEAPTKPDAQEAEKTIEANSFNTTEGIAAEAVDAPVEVVAIENPLPPEPIPGPPPLADLLDLGIEEEIAKEEKERLKGKGLRFPLSPSKFGGCARELAMSLAEYVGLGIYPMEPMEPRGKRRFTRGYDIEYSMMKQLKKYVPIAQGFGQQYLEMARTPDDKYVIGGSMDTLFMSEEHMIVDIKSKATYFSSAMSDSFEECFDAIANMPGVRVFGTRALYIEDIDAFYNRYNKDDFISRYFLQLNAYGACDWSRDFRSNMFPGVVGIRAVALLFENKNNHVMAEIRWKPTRTLYDYAIKRMQDIYQWVVIDKKDPVKYKPDYTLGSLACRLCSRKAACWGDARHPYNGPKKQWPVDANRTKNADQLEAVYMKYKNLLTAKYDHDNIEEELVKEMLESGETKIRFVDGKTYELKYLKTPKPHYELRPSK